MLLGELLRRLSTASDDEVASGFAGEVVRLARLQTAAAARGETLATYVRDAVCRFLETASEEEWATAMGRMRDDPMPGDRLTELAIELQLRRDGV